MVISKPVSLSRSLWMLMMRKVLNAFAPKQLLLCGNLGREIKKHTCTGYSIECLGTVSFLNFQTLTFVVEKFVSPLPQRAGSRKQEEDKGKKGRDYR